MILRAHPRSHEPPGLGERVSRLEGGWHSVRQAVGLGCRARSGFDICAA